MSRNTLFKIARTVGVLVLMFVALSMFLVPPTMAQGPKPPAPKDSVSISATKEMDALVLELAKALNLTDVAYDAYRSPADTVWEDTYKYYADQMTQAGWSGQGATKEIKGGKIGVWLNPADNTMLVLMYIAPTKEDPATYELAVKGKMSDKPVSGTPKLTPLTDSVSVTATPDMDALVSALTKKLNMTDVKYEAWRSPSNTVWEDTFKYYSDQMTQAGWSGQGVTQDFDGGKLGVWLNPADNTAFILIYIAPTKTDAVVYEIAVFGKMAGTASAQPAVKGNVPTALPKMSGLPDMPTMKNAAPNPKLPAPKDAVAKQGTPEIEKMVDDFAVSVKWKTYVWGIWDVPAVTSWGDVFKYYTDLLGQLNINAVGVSKDIEGGNVGVWIGADNAGGLMAIYVKSADGKAPATVLLVVGDK